MLADDGGSPVRFAQDPPPRGGYTITAFEQHVAEMTRQLEEMRRVGDYRAIFHLTYLTFSEQVLAALKDGQFADSRWSIDMCCRFVEAYLEQLRRWERRDSEQCQAWRMAFTAAQAGRANVLQAMFLGMNAHIHYDLAFVTLGACRHAGDLPEEPVVHRALSTSRAGVPVQRYRDFLMVNKLAWQSIPLIQDTVLATFSPSLYWANRLSLRATRFLGARLIMDARDAAWCYTCLLIHARGHRQQNAVSDMIDVHAATVAHLIGMLTLHPGRLWTSARAWMSRGRLLPPGVDGGLVQLARQNAVAAQVALRQLASAGAAPVPVLRQLTASDDLRLAGVFVRNVLERAPVRRRRELRRFLSDGSDEALAVLEVAVESAHLGRAGPRIPVTAVRDRWTERLTATLRCLRVPEVADTPLLRDALMSYVDGLRARLADLGGASHSSSATAAAPTLDEARRTLSTHPDAWVRLCTAESLGWRRSGYPPTHTGDDMTLLIERVLFLKSSLLFMEIEPAVLVDVAEQLHARSFDADDVVVSHGDDIGGIHLIREGRVSVSQERDGHRVEVAVLGPGNSLGELSTLNNTPATADCTALSPVTTLFLPASALATLLHEHSRLAIGLIRLLSEKLVSTTLQIDGTTDSDDSSTATRASGSDISQ